MEYPNWEDKTIMIAEDEDFNFIYLEEVILPTKAKIIQATDGQQAIDLCDKSKIDLILMDIKMPNLNGYEATKAIKKKHPGIPIVAQTAFAMVEEREAILKAGCDGYITKPLDEETIILELEKYLNK